LDINWTEQGAKLAMMVMEDTGDLESLMFHENEERRVAHRKQWIGVDVLEIESFCKISLQEVARYHNHLLRSI
jgi:hypothetical protein